MASNFAPANSISSLAKYFVVPSRPLEIESVASRLKIYRSRHNTVIKGNHCRQLYEYVLALKELEVREHFRFVDFLCPLHLRQGSLKKLR